MSDNGLSIPIHFLYNEQAEESLLTAALNTSRAVERVAALATDDFYLPHTRCVLIAIKTLATDRKPVTVAMVLEELRRGAQMTQLKNKRGESYIEELAANAVDVDVDAHVELVLQKAKFRHLLAIEVDLRRALIGGEDPDGVAEVIRGRLERFDVPAVPDAEPPTRACDVLRSDSFKQAQRTYASGFSELDEMIAGGIKARALTTVAAPTGDGKTGLVGTWALAWARQGIPVLWCATEIDLDEQSSRFAAIDFHQRELRATPDDFLALRIEPEQGAAALDGLPLYVFNLDEPDGDVFTLIELKAAAIRNAHGQPPIIIVDYLQILAVEDEDQRRLSVTKVATKLRRIARALDAAVLAISSVSRAYYGAAKKKADVDAEENPRDWLAAAKESGDIEYASAVFIYLDRDPDVDTLGESSARLIVAKSRRGTTGFVGARFHGPSGAFASHGGALTVMAPPSRSGKLEARILAFVRGPAYQPLTKNDLREMVRGGSKGDRDAAIERMLADGRLALEESSRPNTVGKLRKVMLIVAGAKLVQVNEERQSYVD